MAPQLMPVGLLLTVPAPWPARDIASRTVGVNVAVTAVAVETFTVQGPVPVHGPLVQPVNTEFGPGVAVRVTAVPLRKLPVQLAPQSMPAGLLVTVPVPVPARATVSAKIGVNVGVTVVAPEILTVQPPVPLHPPPVQPVNAEFAFGVAMSVTAVPIGKLAEQVPPQAMPAGLHVTVPSPAPVRETVRT